jgi:tRNA(adenine34) deaminase
VLSSGSDVDIVLMREALQEAERAAEAGEVPVGAVVVMGSEIVGRGRNQPIGAGDPTAHAEVVALREAARTLGNYRLTGVRLYVTVEPCLMCVGAIVHARVGTLIFGAREPKAGAVVSAQQSLNHPALNHRVEVVEGVLAEESRDLLQRFFQARRAASKPDAS